MGPLASTFFPSNQPPTHRVYCIYNSQSDYFEIEVK